MAATNSSPHSYKIPDGSRVVQLESLPPEQQHQYLTLMEPLLAKAYPQYVKQEDITHRWFDSMQQPLPTTSEYEMGITAVIKHNETSGKDEVLGFTTTEFLGKAAYHGYSVGQYTDEVDEKGGSLKHPLHAEEYANVMYASKKGAFDNIKERQAAGQIINLDIQEGASYKSAHLDKMIPGLAAGQVSLASDTATIPLKDSVIPVYKGDIPQGATPEEVKAIVEDPFKVDLLITNLEPSEKNKPFKDIMGEFKTDYLKLHGSPVVDPDNSNTQFKDPYAQIMDNYIAKLPPELTVQQAYAAAQPGAAQRLGLGPNVDIHQNRERDGAPDMQRLDQKQLFMKEHPIKVWDGANLSNIIVQLTDGKVTPAMIAEVMKANPDLGNNPDLIHPGDTLHLESLAVTDKGFKLYQTIVHVQESGLNASAQNTLYSHVTSHLDDQTNKQQIAHNDQQQQAAEAQAQDAFAFTA
jgi:hypothetical protein